MSFSDSEKQDVAQENPANGSNAATFVADFVANDRFIVVQKTNSLFKVWMVLVLDQIKQNQTLSMIAVRLKPQQLVNLDYRCVRPAITIAM